MTRKLAKIVRLSSVEQHPNADLLDIVKWGGWQCVTKRGEFNAGDLVVALEIDTWVPHTLAPFLSKGEPREYNGIKGERLRTMTLRGALSQGLVLPVSDIIGPDMNGVPFFPEDGLDLTEFLFETHGLQKWEPPIEAHLAGLIKGQFPSDVIRKTDQERFQNLYPEVTEAINYGHLFEVTVKMDGSSMTVYNRNGNLGVCSRNLELKLEGNDENSLIKTAKDSGLLDALRSLGRNIAIQGELMGKGIQKNRDELKGHHFFVYDIFDIDRQQYLSPVERLAVLDELVDLGASVPHVPILHTEASLKSLGVFEPDDLHKIAGGKGYNSAEREGLVFKRSDGKFSFKAIDNKYLRKNNE